MSVPAVEPTIKPMVLGTEDQLLDETQRVRLGIVNQLIKKGTAPEDPKELTALLKTLEGVDKQVLTKKRIATDEGLGNKQLQAAATIAALFNDVRSKTFNSVPLDETVAPRTEAPKLDDTVPTPVLVPGELGHVGELEDYKGFMKRINAKAPAKAA